MSPLTFCFIILALTSCVHSEQYEDNLLEIPSFESSELETRGLNVFDIIKKFDVCYLKCNGKYCECCQKIKVFLFGVEVCGISQLKPAEGIIDVGVKVSGVRLAGTKVKLDRLVHICIPLKSSLGQLKVCVDSSISELPARPNWFTLCAKAEVSFEDVPSVQVNFKCLQLNGDAYIDGKKEGGFKTVASIKILNGDQLAKAVQKIISEKKNKKLITQ